MGHAPALLPANNCSSGDSRLNYAQPKSGCSTGRSALGHAKSVPFVSEKENGVTHLPSCRHIASLWLDWSVANGHARSWCLSQESTRVSRDLTRNLKRDRAAHAILRLFRVHFTLFALADAYGTRSAIPVWIRSYDLPPASLWTCLEKYVHENPFRSRRNGSWHPGQRPRSGQRRYSD